MPRALAAAFERLRALLRQPDVRAERNDAHDAALIEGFIPGREYALEGLMHHGALHVLAIFDKPDPLDGPFFEETIYLTPSSRAGRDAARDRRRASARAAAALGLRTARSTPSAASTRDGVFVLEVAARPIGGLCARALRFVDAVRDRRWPQSHPFARGAAAAARARRRSRRRGRARRARVGRDDDSDPAARHLSRRRRRRRGARGRRASTRSGSPRSPISCWCRCPKARAISGSSSRAAASRRDGRAGAARRARAAASSRSIPNCRCSTRPDTLQSRHG